MLNKYGKKMIVMFILAMSLFVVSGCGEKSLEYTITVEGTAQTSGTLSFLDYSISVYQDESENTCGDCAYQPAHLYVGDDGEAAVAAIQKTVEDSDDLWEVASAEGNVIVLREKEAGSIEAIPPLSGPEGYTLTGEAGGRNVKISSGQKTTKVAEGVIFPENPQRLAAVYGPSYELLTMLGAEDRIVVRADVQTDDFPWAERVFSRIKDIPMLDNVHTSVNFEELMKYQPDLVYAFPRQNELTQLEEAGVAALAGETGETLADLKEQVCSYGKTLGEEGKAKAEEYCRYFDEKLAMIRERTEDIPEEERPDVYYAGVDILTTYGKYSDLMQVISFAGGNPVTGKLKAGNRTQIDYEQLMEWDPDVIFIDHGGMNDGKTAEEIRRELMASSVYQSISAVKKEEVYLSPSGVFYWDMGLQKILLVMYMAKILHPDIFSDLDMEGEVMEFYHKFFEYDLTREEAARILARQDP